MPQIRWLVERDLPGQLVVLRLRLVRVDIEHIQRTKARVACGVKLTGERYLLSDELLNHRRDELRYPDGIIPIGWPRPRWIEVPLIHADRQLSAQDTVDHRANMLYRPSQIADARPASVFRILIAGVPVKANRIGQIVGGLRIDEELLDEIRVRVGDYRAEEERARVDLAQQ